MRAIQDAPTATFPVAVVGALVKLDAPTATVLAARTQALMVVNRPQSTPVPCLLAANPTETLAVVTVV